MTTYYVMSQKPDEEVPGIETKRTDRKAAENDVDIIKTILGRAAWIEETEE